MAPKPKEQSGTTTTTQPPIGPQAPTTTTTVPLDPATLALISGMKGLFGSGGTRTLGLSGVAELADDGRVISYQGPTKVIGGQDVRPQYFEGDENDIATWDSEKIARIQRQLAAGGYFSGSSFQVGIVRQSTIDAYRRLLEDSNMSFITAEQALERSKKIPYSGGGSGLTKYRMTSSMDLSNVFDKVSQSVLGRTLDTQELDKLVKTYQGVEIAGQKSQAGVAEQAPTAAAFAQKKIEAGNQDEADAVQFAQYAQVLEGMLGG